MDLDEAKRRLVEALKDSTQKYWEVMKSWYRRKISKEEFDSKAKALLGEGNVSLHNEFLFAILVKCQTGIVQPGVFQKPSSPQVLPTGSSVGLAMPRAKRPHLDPTVLPVPGPTRAQASATPPKPCAVPYQALDVTQCLYALPELSLSSSSSCCGGIDRDLDTVLLCSHSLYLPDGATLHTRMLLGVWEAGLEEVAEEATLLLSYALECFLKNIVAACIAQQSNYRLRYDSFQHAFGSGHAPSSCPAPRVPEPHPVCTTAAERASVEVSAQSTPVPTTSPLTLFNLRDTLMVNKWTVPVHSVMACSVERVLAFLWHRSQEEEEHLRTVRQWKASLRPPQPGFIKMAPL